MLKIIDGLRTANHANSVADILNQSVAAQVNAVASVDMSEHNELLTFGLVTGVTGTGTGGFFIQESNEASANFTNVTNAIQTGMATNTVKVISTDWRKPNRLRYARVCAINATNAVTMMAVTARVLPKSNNALGNNAIQTDT